MRSCCSRWGLGLRELLVFRFRLGTFRVTKRDLLTADRSIEAELTSSTRSVPDCFDYALELAREEPCLDSKPDVFFCFLPFFEVFAFVA